MMKMGVQKVRQDLVTNESRHNKGGSISDWARVCADQRARLRSLGEEASRSCRFFWRPFFLENLTNFETGN